MNFSVSHRRECKHWRTAAKIKDNAVIPTAFVAMHSAVQRFILIDAMPVAAPAALQPPGNFFGRIPIQLHANGKAPFTDGQQNRHCKRHTIGLCSQDRNPVAISVPMAFGQWHTLPTYPQEGANQRHFISATNLDHSLMLHGKIGNVLNSRGQFVDLWQGEKLIAGWKIRFHRNTSH